MEDTGLAVHQRVKGANILPPKTKQAPITLNPGRLLKLNCRILLSVLQSRGRVLPPGARPEMSGETGTLKSCAPSLIIFAIQLH